MMQVDTNSVRAPRMSTLIGSLVMVSTPVVDTIVKLKIIEPANCTSVFL